MGWVGLGWALGLDWALGWVRLWAFLGLPGFRKEGRKGLGRRHRREASENDFHFYFISFRRWGLKDDQKRDILGDGMKRIGGEYAIWGKIGEGSFATVYKGEHGPSREVVAVKVIARSRLSGKLAENLESEIDILKNIQETHIVKLRDIKKTERHYYLVMEFCAGGDLQKRIRKNGPMDEEKARYFFGQLGKWLV